MKQEIPLLTGITKTGDLNSTVNGTSSFQILSTDTNTLNLPTALPWMYIVQLNGPVNISQLAFPMYLSGDNRLQFRAQAGLNSTTPITTSWREIPYVDETPLLQDNGNNTKKISVDRLEGTADSSVSQDYIQNLGDYTNKTAGELKQAILNAISTFNSKACIYIRVQGNISKACQNWANDSYVIEPGETLNTICIRNIYDRGRWAFIEIFSYGYDKYVTFLSNGRWMPMKKVSLVDV